MIPGIHFDVDCTSAPMVHRGAARMAIRWRVDRGWTLEHIDVKRNFLNEEYAYYKPFFIREGARAYGTYRDGKTIGIILRNLYGNPSGTYYYVQGLLNHSRAINAKLNEAEECLVRVQMLSGAVIAAIPVDNFLVAEETPSGMDEFVCALRTKYEIKRLGKPHRYLGWH